MGNFFLSLVAVVLFAASAWGWGRAAERVFCGASVRGWAYPVALGLAVWAVVGGLLNVLDLAFPAALWGLLAIGWVLAAAMARGQPSTSGHGWRNWSSVLRFSTAKTDS